MPDVDCDILCYRMAPRKKAARKCASVEHVVDSEEEENDDGAACEPTDVDREKRQELERNDRGSKKYIGAHVRIKGTLYVFPDVMIHKHTLHTYDIAALVLRS